MVHLWLSILSPNFINLLGPLSLIVIGFLVEKNFVGRITTFCNALAINLHVYTLLATTGKVSSLLIWYANGGLVLGIIGLIAYSILFSLPQIFYILSWLYSSILVGGIILITSF
mgnify:CR=1 FL=1